MSFSRTSFLHVIGGLIFQVNCLAQKKESFWNGPDLFLIQNGQIACTLGLINKDREV